MRAASVTNEPESAHKVAEESDRQGPACGPEANSPASRPHNCEEKEDCEISGRCCIRSDHELTRREHATCTCNECRREEYLSEPEPPTHTLWRRHLSPAYCRQPVSVR